MGWITDLLKEIPSAARYKAELEEFEAECVTLRTENSSLRSELSDLRASLIAQEPSVRINEKTEMILKFFFDCAQQLTNEQIATKYQMTSSVAESHFDILKDKKLLKCTRIGSRINGRINQPAFTISKEGRAYVNTHIQS